VADIPRKTIRQSLKNKGFALDKGRGDHERYYFTHNGKKCTHITARVSRGSSYKTYSASLWTKMKHLLQLDTNKQVKDLLTCPMDLQHYLSILKSKKQV